MKKTRKTTAAAASKKRSGRALVLGSTILAGQAGGRAVGRAATKTYGWIKDHVAGLMKPAKKPKKKAAKKRSIRTSKR